MGTPKSVKNRQKTITDSQLNLGKDLVAKQNALYQALVYPALQGQPPAYFQNAIAPAINEGFQGARENLTQFFGSSGQGNSGISAGPLANLFGQEARAGADARNQAIIQALGLGFQGNQVFNPLGAFQGANNSNANLAEMSKNPALGILGGLAGAALLANPIGGLFGRRAGAAPNANGLPVNGGLGANLGGFIPIPSWNPQPPVSGFGY